jgi:hypothetical protein
MKMPKNSSTKTADRDIHYAVFDHTTQTVLIQKWVVPEDADADSTETVAQFRIGDLMRLATMVNAERLPSITETEDEDRMEVSMAPIPEGIRASFR